MSLANLSENPVWINGLIFALAAAMVWFAGTKLSVYADVISDRTGMGRAFTGLVLLATVTSLPEIATTATASALGNAPLVTSNLFGGIAMQTAILSIADFKVVPGALTYFSPKPVLLIQGVLLILMLAVAILVTTLGEPAAVLDVGVGSAFLFLLYIAFLYASRHYQDKPKWGPLGDENEQKTPPDDAKKHLKDVSGQRLYGVFALLALAVALGGWSVARSADMLATQTGINASLVGAILVAISTSLPEVSTTLSAARFGAYGMAISNILGSNALMLALAFPGDIIYGGVLLRNVEESTIYLLPLGIVVTCIYLWGLLERRDKTILGMGMDSILVVLTYVGGMLGMYFMLQAG